VCWRGRNPWTGISVRREDVRRQLEQEFVASWCTCEQAYVLEWNRPKRLPTSYRHARRFFSRWRAVLRLAGRTPPPTLRLWCVTRCADRIRLRGTDEPAAYRRRGDAARRST